jgi:hypothetical protein
MDGECKVTVVSEKGKEAVVAPSMRRGISLVRAA